MRFVPFILFICFSALAAVSLLRLQEHSTSASPWIGHTLPTFSAHLLSDGEVAPNTSAVITAQPTIINIFASWCAPCVVEHPLLKTLAKESKITLVGIAWNDTEDKVQAFLSKHGNPYNHVYLDNGTGAALALGIRGVPETFIVDAEGVVRFHSAGPLTADMIAREVLPLLEAIAP